MASHFKQPDEGSRAGAHSEAAGSSRPRTGGNPRRHLQTRRGGDESYHAPEGNPHAAGMPRSTVGYVSVVSEPGDDARGHNRRRRESHFVETDPYDLSGRRSRDPKKRVARVLSVILFVVGIGLIVAAGGLWLHNQWQYAEQDRINEELATYADVSSSGSSAPQVDWAGLKAVNDEVVGWVQIPDTPVNFPVYQASDNEKYLHTSAEGEYAVGGQLFMDYENAAPGMVDAQTIVYGHHLRNGSMFKAVADMADQGVFDSISTVWYVTESGSYELEPLLVYQTTGDDTNVRQFNFASVEEFRAYLTDLLGRATASRSDAADVIASTSQVLSLCTCYYEDTDKGRTILVCVPKSAPDQADAAQGTDAAGAEDPAEPTDPAAADAANEG